MIKGSYASNSKLCPFTHLVTGVKSRDASASKNKGPWKVCLQIRGRTGGFPGWSVQLVVVGHFRGCRTPGNEKTSGILKR